MPRVTFVAFDGTPHIVEADCGTSLMRAATDGRVPGIDGDCGGNCACATCHVYVDPAWSERVGVRTGTEREMLNLVPDFQDNSRLACQITLDDSLNGMVVAVPESQH
jgi:2Fe-2S ferredoxin